MKSPVTIFSLLLLCSCATEKSNPPPLPPTVTMNPDAGRGDNLTITVHLADGKNLPLEMDTGCPVTAFDQSLHLPLGKRLATSTFFNFGAKQEMNVYHAPKLYLGNVPLQTVSASVITFDRRKLSDQGQSSLMGLLGMDILQNYCIQLDFTAGQVRFLDDARADKKTWGQAFPLTDVGDGCCSIPENLAGAKGPGSLIDTGCNFGGWLQPALFQQWTNQNTTADGTLGGEMYHDLDLHPLSAKSLASNDGHIKLNGIGLRALAQNLVTLDFPNHTLYLKHTSDSPLPDQETLAEYPLAEKSSLKTFDQLFKNGQLPGISKGQHGRTTTFLFTHDSTHHLDTATWDGLKEGDPSLYHYTLTRPSKNDPWKLQKAWRTDPTGHPLETFPVP